MGESYGFVDIIVFAVIAGFLVLRLRNVLGRRTGTEAPPPKDAFGARPAPAPQDSGDSTVVRLPQREAREGVRRGGRGEGDPLPAGLTQIKIADPGFSQETFIKGARSAFEMVVDSFAKGDHDTLRALLSDDVYANFARAISAREGRGETFELTLVGISETSLLEAVIEGTRALITVKFVSEQIKVTRGDKDQVVDGEPGKIIPTTDIWTFARDTRSRNPNWTLVATEAAN